MGLAYKITTVVYPSYRSLQGKRLAPNLTQGMNEFKRKPCPGDILERRL